MEQTPAGTAGGSNSTLLTSGDRVPVHSTGVPTAAQAATVTPVQSLAANPSSQTPVAAPHHPLPAVIPPLPPNASVPSRPNSSAAPVSAQPAPSQAAMAYNPMTQALHAATSASSVHARGTSTPQPAVSAPRETTAAAPAATRLPMAAAAAPPQMVAGQVSSVPIKRPTVFNLLKEKYKGDKNRNRILEVIQLYLHQNGKTMAINETPLINGKIIDLSTLFLAIAGQGGFAKVDPVRGWTDLAGKMGYNIPGVIETAGATLRDVYSQIFLSFELQLSSKKAQAQQAAQNSKQPPSGGAVTANPASEQTVSTVPNSTVPNRDVSKSSKKRDRAQMDVSASAEVAGGETPQDPPAFSYNRNSCDKTLLAQSLEDICSNNVSTLVRGLNTFTLRSAEFEARGLNLESYPNVIIALGDLLDLANPMAAIYFENAVKEQNMSSIQRERNGIDWELTPAVYSVESLDDNSILLTVLNILRNISFEVSNEALLAHSSKIVAHVVFLLHAPVVPDKLMPECVAYAFDILTNIGKTIDLSGRKRKFHKDNWVIDTIEDDDREALKARCTQHYSIQSNDVYMVASYSLFPRLVYFMESTNRDYVYKAIDCFGHLVQAEENVELLNNCPAALPNLLVELLCVSVTTADTALPASCVQNDVAEMNARPSPMICSFSDQCDIAIRDLTLYALYMLVCLSTKWRHLVPTLPRSLDVLRRISFSLPRTESSSRAQQILAVMTMDLSNKTEYLRMQNEMCVAACGDEVISDIIFSTTGNNFYTNDSTKVSSAGSSAGVSAIPRIRWG